jgi:iron transport multicopper oxidase
MYSDHVCLSALQTTFKDNVHTAILRYQGAPIALPPKPADVDVPVHTKILKESELRPIVPQPVPGNHSFEHADVYFNFFTLLNRTANLFLMGNGTYGKTFTPPTVPILLQVLSGARDASEILPEGAVYTIPPNKVIEVTIPGDITGPHPFHLHGHDFYVVKSADGDIASPNWDNAIMRDTVNAGTRDQSVTFR